jgi:hypothetical protein
MADTQTEGTGTGVDFFSHWRKVSPETPIIFPSSSGEEPVAFRILTFVMV